MEDHRKNCLLAALCVVQPRLINDRPYSSGYVTESKLSQADLFDGVFKLQWKISIRAATNANEIRN